MKTSPAVIPPSNGNRKELKKATNGLTKPSIDPALVETSNSMELLRVLTEVKNGNFTVSLKELAFQNDEKEKRAAELGIANKEFAIQNDEKEKRAAELSVANKEVEESRKSLEKKAEHTFTCANIVKTNKQNILNLNLLLF